jgi:hypothetical protein
MVSINGIIVPKAPRWINTDAGHHAWAIDLEWRRVAERAFSVNERRRLLDEAERMLQQVAVTVEAD